MEIVKAKRVGTELTELKGILTAQKKSYDYMAELLKISKTNFSDKINGYLFFSAFEIFLIAKDCNLSNEQVQHVFFNPIELVYHTRTGEGGEAVNG